MNPILKITTTFVKIELFMFLQKNKERIFLSN